MKMQHLTLALAVTLGASFPTSVRAEEGGSGYHLLGTSGSLAGNRHDRREDRRDDRHDRWN
jgi:hypothetical protein